MPSEQFLSRDTLWPFSSVFKYFGLNEHETTFKKEQSLIFLEKNWYIRPKMLGCYRVHLIVTSLLCPSNSNITIADKVLTWYGQVNDKFSLSNCEVSSNFTRRSWLLSKIGSECNNILVKMCTTLDSNIPTKTQCQGCEKQSQRF